MASKLFYSSVAAVGIATLSVAAWWLQHRSAPLPATSDTGKAATPAAGKAGAGRPAGGPGGGASRPVAVEVAEVKLATLADEVRAVGTLRSQQGVMLRPEISGRVTALHFRDGQRVRQGQLLVQLDDRLPQAQLRQSEAELAIAQANHKRNQDLLAQGFISQRMVDESAAGFQVAQARLALARASLARLRIVAPFSGIVGIRNVNVGDYLKDGADIVNLENIDTVYVDYRLPERYQALLRAGQKLRVELDALPGRSFEARIEAIDPLIDANGRSVGVRARIGNREGLLRPGMFARVTSVFKLRERALMIPEEAVVPLEGRLFAILLLPGAEQGALVSKRVEIKLGSRRPGQVEILEGLKAGDTIVTAGHHRLQRDGSPVKVVDLNRPAAR